MKISHIKISNILGIEELEFTPEGFNAITGQNGKGKTSVLEAIKSAIGTGQDATLLRKGAEKGEVVLVLDDGTELHERVTPSGITRTVMKDGKKVGRPADAIKALTDALSVNPAQFLAADPKDRVKTLLTTMPINLDIEHLSKISGVAVKADASTNPLALIDLVRKQVYDDRTGTNRAVKEKDATINQMQLAMPEAPGGVEGDEDSIRAQIDAARDARDTTLGKIKTKLDGIDAETTKQLNALRDELQQKIDAIKAEYQEKADVVKANLADNANRAAAAREKANNTFTEIATPLNAALAGIAANRDAASKRKVAQETIAQMTEDLEVLKQDAERQTKALEDIDAYKEQLLNEMPIKGLAVQDGDILLDGITFDRLNTAKQVSVALQIAQLRAGDLAVCCLDGMELLDSEHLEQLEQQAQDMGLQVFVTRVTDGEFAVDAK